MTSDDWADVFKAGRNAAEAFYEGKLNPTQALARVLWAMEKECNAIASRYE
jgi:hypothetical protein